MPKPYKTKNNKEEGKQYYAKIIETLSDNVSRLEKELERYKDTPKIARGILTDLETRKRDLKYYEELAGSYKKDKWIN